MPSPFPGMDPFLEISGDWRDFHARFLNGCADALSDYLYKRVSLIARTIHLLELDLLIAGRRLPMGRPLRGIYHALVSRAEKRPISEVFSWSIRDSLPTIPVPFLAPDGDISLDLSAIFKTIYRRGQYERSIDYQAPLDLPLSPKDRAWAEELARDHGDADGR